MTNKPISGAQVTATKLPAESAGTTGAINGLAVGNGMRPQVPSTTSDSNGRSQAAAADDCGSSDDQTGPARAPRSLPVYGSRTRMAVSLLRRFLPACTNCSLRQSSIPVLSLIRMLKDVVFRLIPGGTISDRVADATGEPIAEMTVQLVRSSYDSNGKRAFQMASLLIL
jgi:hypothetical protein